MPPRNWSRTSGCSSLSLSTGWSMRTRSPRASRSARCSWKSRRTPALAWLGSGLGGIGMGQLAMRFGIRWTVMFGSSMICVGLALSTLGPGWPLYVGHGVFMGLLGNAGLNAPLYVYVSRWFDRRRGSALALLSSGSYFAGAVWPPILERAIAAVGWRQTMLMYALFELALIVPLALLYLRTPPDT